MRLKIGDLVRIHKNRFWESGLAAPEQTLRVGLVARSWAGSPVASILSNGALIQVIVARLETLTDERSDNE